MPAKYICKIRFTEEARSCLCVALGIINWACILTSLMLAAGGGYIRLTIQEYTNLVANYDADSLPFLLVGVGLISAIVNGIGGFICFVSSDPNKREKLKTPLLIYIIMCICVCICVAAGAIMCYTHIQHLHESFKSGLLFAMKEYGHRPHIKYELDKLQMDYQCCGNNNYEDWYEIPWIDSRYMHVGNATPTGNNGEPESRQLMKAFDVPFSCCNPNVHRPCVHTAVTKNSLHINYDHKVDVTLHKDGCRNTLMDYLGHVVLKNFTFVVLSIFALQIILIILVRFLQTSMLSALELGAPTFPSYGYLFALGRASEENAEDGKSEKSKASRRSIDNLEYTYGQTTPLLEDGSRHVQPTYSHPSVRSIPPHMTSSRKSQSYAAPHQQQYSYVGVADDTYMQPVSNAELHTRESEGHYETLGAFGATSVSPHPQGPPYGAPPAPPPMAPQPPAPAPPPFRL